MYRHFLSFFLAITIDQPRPKFHCVKQLYTPQLSVTTVHSPHHCLLITIRISIADLIGGTRGYRVGYPYAWAPLDVKKIVLIFTVKNMVKFKNL